MSLDFFKEIKPQQVLDLSIIGTMKGSINLELNKLSEFVGYFYARDNDCVVDGLTFDFIRENRDNANSDLRCEFRGELAVYSDDKYYTYHFRVRSNFFSSEQMCGKFESINKYISEFLNQHFNNGIFKMDMKATMSKLRDDKYRLTTSDLLCLLWHKLPVVFNSDVEIVILPGGYTASKFKFIVTPDMDVSYDAITSTGFASVYNAGIVNFFQKLGLCEKLPLPYDVKPILHKCRNYPVNYSSDSVYYSESKNNPVIKTVFQSTPFRGDWFYVGLNRTDVFDTGIVVGMLYELNFEKLQEFINTAKGINNQTGKDDSEFEKIIAEITKINSKYAK